MRGEIHPWSNKETTYLLHSSSSPSDQRFITRERGVGCVPVSMHSFNTGPLSKGKPGGASASTSAFWDGSPSTGSVNASPSAAKEMWLMSSAVPSTSVVPE